MVNFRPARGPKTRGPASFLGDPETGKTATSHDTRRGFAVQMDLAGVTLPERQQWMDHGDSRTTQKYYHKTSADQLAARFWPSGKGFGGKSGGKAQESKTAGGSDA